MGVTMSPKLLFRGHVLSMVLVILFLFMEPPISILGSLLVSLALLLMIGVGIELFRKQSGHSA